MNPIRKIGNDVIVVVYKKNVYWYKFLRKIRQAWKIRKCFMERNRNGNVWIAKKDLHSLWEKPHETEDIVYNIVRMTINDCTDDKKVEKVAYTSDEYS